MMRKLYRCSIVLLGLWWSNANISAEQIVLDEVYEVDSEMVETVSMVSLVAEKLESIRNADRRIANAFITVDPRGAFATAQWLDSAPQDIDLPLKGFTFAIKDNIEMAGLPSTAGTDSLRAFIPTVDAEVVKRLKMAGATIIGKTNLHELAFGATNINFAFGTVGNVYNHDYLAGGSSGGTAVAVASGFSRAGLGTDTGGSGRIPAALNGIVGFRPTTERYSSDGLFRLSSTRDTVAPFGLNVADVALIDAVLSGDNSKLEDIDISTLRLGVPRQYFYDDLDPSVAQAMKKVLTQLRSAGVTLIEADIEVAELNRKLSFPIVIYESGQQLPDYLVTHNIGLSAMEFQRKIASPDVQQIIAHVLASEVTEEEYKQALSLRLKLQKVYQRYFDDNKVDAVIFPTTPLPARPIDGITSTVELNGKQVKTFETYIRNVDASSNAGIPSLSIPMGKSAEGLPMGLSIEAVEGEDRRLLAIGKALETVLND